MRSFCVVICVICALVVFSVGALGAPPKAVEKHSYTTVDTIDQELTVVPNACVPAVCAPVVDACACPNGVCPVQPRQRTNQILLPPKKTVVTVERSHKGLVRSVIGVATAPVRLVGKVVTGVKQRVQGRRGARQTRRAVRSGGCC